MHTKRFWVRQNIKATLHSTERKGMIFFCFQQLIRYFNNKEYIGTWECLRFNTIKRIKNPSNFRIFFTLIYCRNKNYVILHFSFAPFSLNSSRFFHSQYKNAYILQKCISLRFYSFVFQTNAFIQSKKMRHSIRLIAIYIWLLNPVAFIQLFVFIPMHFSFCVCQMH